MNPKTIDTRREMFKSYDRNIVTINGKEYWIIAVFKDTTANVVHLLVSRVKDSRLYHVLQLHEYTAQKIDRSTLILIDYMQKEKRLHWLYTRDRVYHCFHVCLCKKCRALNGKIYTHSQANWDGHLRYVDTDDVFTFPTAVNV